MSFVAQYMLNSHSNTHVVDKKLTVQCLQCPKKFFSQKNLINHKYIHSEEKLFPCDKCNSSFKRRSGLNSHLKTHLEEKPWLCNPCGKSFRFKVSFKKHQDVHTNTIVLSKNQLYPKEEESLGN